MGNRQKTGREEKTFPACSSDFPMSAAGSPALTKPHQYRNEAFAQPQMPLKFT